MKNIKRIFKGPWQFIVIFILIATAIWVISLLYTYIIESLGVRTVYSVFVYYVGGIAILIYILYKLRILR